MESRAFGRRGVAGQASPPIAFARAQPDAVFTPPTAAARIARGTGEKSLAAHLPILTVSTILFLLTIFGIQQRLAFDIGKGGRLSLESLIACGAVSYDRLIGSGEWWRAFLAPLLHASASHVLGNCFALFFIGMRLEPLIGRAWFGALFAISALGGVAGSMIGNPHFLTTVGASGAITGMLAALFVVSFRHQGDAIDARAMRTTSLRFGVPALAPLAFGASGHTDYFAHAGGAVAGGLVGLLMVALWSDEDMRPAFTREAAAVALLGLMFAAAACAFAAPGFGAREEAAAQLVPSSDFANVLNVTPRRSVDLVARYPNDPRAHILHAVALARTRNLAYAESELRQALAMPSGDAGRVVNDFARALLGIVLVDEGRRGEATSLVAAICRDPGQKDNQAILKKSRLCE